MTRAEARGDEYRQFRLQGNRWESPVERVSRR